MSASAERRIVLVTRRTRLDELVARHNTLAQAQFYVEHLGADFGEYRRGFARRQGSFTESLGKRPSRHILHTEVRLSVPLANFVDRHDGRVVELGRRLGLDPKPLPIHGRRKLTTQDHLDRDFTSQANLPCTIDDPHSSPTQLLDHLVIAEEIGQGGGTCRERLFFVNRWFVHGTASGVRQKYRSP